MWLGWCAGHVAMVSKERSVPTCSAAILSVPLSLLGGHPDQHDHQHQHQDHDADADHD